jgi:hypothetical protein
VAPKIPRSKNGEPTGWEIFQKGEAKQRGRGTIYAVLTILRFLLLRVAPHSGWSGRLHALLERYPEIPLKAMGFPEGWQASPLWQ